MSSFGQNLAHLLNSTDMVYKGFVTGCALAGPSGCAIAKSENDTALDIDAAIQDLITAAHTAEKANASTPIRSGDIRRKCASSCTVLLAHVAVQCSSST